MRWIAALAICLAVSSSARGDWGARRDPFDPGVVSRYKAILARDPYDAGALRQLVAMYRRYRTVAKLEAEYRAQGEGWATLAVLAQLPGADALPLWKRVVAIKPDDARAWIAIGDAARTDVAVARDAYLRASKAATTPKLKRTALTRLVAAARDAPTVDAAYAELIALSPKDGKLWLDRGNAQITAKQFAVANDSFVAAEALFRTDPERRLTAITSQGIALEGLGRVDDAIAQYERALDAMPRGYFLAQEVVMRIVDAQRKRRRLDGAIAWLEQRWPDRRRGYFEWALLGDLYAEVKQDERALAAYRRAVKKAPTEVATQRKLIALLDKLHPAEALAQHEAAARLAPGDGPLHLELAKRYPAGQRDKALATLAALARRLRTNVNIRRSIGALYEELGEPQRAIREYEAVATLEPEEPDHAILLGEAYWRANEPDKARAAWRRLEKIETAEAAFRHGEVLAMHEAWDEAVLAYTTAIARAPANADALYGRARAYEALLQYPSAIADARRAVALGARAQLDAGLRDRNMLVRLLGKQYQAGHANALGDTLARWRFAFERGDVGAGYLLAAHHSRIRSEQRHEVLVALYRRAPTDDALGFAVVRSYLRRRELAQARAELARIGRRKPEHAKQIAAMRVEIDEEHARMEREIRLAEEGRRLAAQQGKATDLVGRQNRTGMRFAVGSDVHASSGALLGWGFYRTYRLGNATAWTWRFDWTKRDDDFVEHKALGIGVGITRRIVDARRFELAAGAGARIELRYGNGIPNEERNRGGLGADLSLELLPRAIGATLGLRFHNAFTDPPRGSTLLVELGFELR